MHSSLDDAGGGGRRRRRAAASNTSRLPSVGLRARTHRRDVARCRAALVSRFRLPLYKSRSMTEMANDCTDEFSIVKMHFYRRLRQTQLHI